MVGNYRMDFYILMQYLVYKYYKNCYDCTVFEDLRFLNVYFTCVSPINPNELSLSSSFSLEITISITSFDVSISLKTSFKHSD